MATMEPPSDFQSVQLAERQRRGDLVVRTLPILVLPFAMTAVAAILLRATGQITGGELPQTAVEPANPLVPIVVMVTFLSAQIGRSSSAGK
jgi:hypothetical protein